MKILPGLEGRNAVWVEVTVSVIAYLVTRDYDSFHNLRVFHRLFPYQEKSNLDIRRF